jgi:UDP-N-acetyl-D-mannosaminuronate dehydrogenase
VSPAGASTADLIDVVVGGGGGHVGLPLALSLASAGMRVRIQDVSETTVARIQAGETTDYEDFNLSTAQSTTVLELAQAIWR